MTTARFPLAALFLLASLAQAQGTHSLIRIPEPTKEELAIRQTKALQTLERASGAVVHVAVNISGVFNVQRESSGICIHPKGWILTNWHLVKEALDEDGKERETHEVQVRNSKGDTWESHVIAKAPEVDLALVKMRLDEDEKMPYVELGDSRNILPGETILVASRPEDKIYANFIGSASDAQGPIKIDDHVVARDDLLLSDANIKILTDGAPVLDINGRLLAIVNTSRVGRALPKKPTEEEKRAARLSFGFAMRAHVASRVFEKELAKLKIKTPKPSAREASARTGGIAGIVAKSRDAIVSVRRASIQKMPEPDILDPHGKFMEVGLGSGVVVHDSGLVLTNAHIVGDSEEVVITTLSGKTYPGKVVAKRTEKNIALIQLKLPKGATLPFLPLADSDDGILGERVVAVGNRYGHTLAVKAGVLSSKQRSQDVGDQHKRSMAHFQTDATIYHGNTGGALLNLEGQVLGINDFIASIDEKDQAASHEAWATLTDTTIGFALPANWIREQLRAELTDLVGAEGHLIIRPKPTEDSRQRRESQITRVVEAHSNCFLNVFVKKAILGKNQGGFGSELFPEPADDKDFHLLGQGSGVVIDPTGLALTNWHVVDKATYPDGSAHKDFKVFVSMSNGKKYEVEILSTSRIDDLALLQLKLTSGEKLQAIRLGDSDSTKVGETAIAVGNPHGYANSVTVGLVSAKDRDIRIAGRARYFRGLIQTDAGINPGNSGGALIDLNGYLIGINNAGNRLEAREGFAIPVNYVRKKFHTTLLSSDKLRSVYLGMETRTGKAGGAWVSKVSTFGPAADAGVNEGDQILKVQGQEIASSIQFVKIARAAAPFRPFTMEVRRRDQTEKLTLEPVSDASWAIFKRANFAVKEVTFADAAKELKQASIAAYREYTGEPEGMPSSIMESGLMVTHVHPGAVADGMDMKKGDVIIGFCKKERAIHLNDRYVLEYITSQKVMLDIIRNNATKEGKRVELWVARDGKVIKASVVAKKPLPQ